MSAERLITTPPNARYLSIPQEYLRICSTTQTRKITRGQNKGQEYAATKTDEVAATLLYLVERWVLWKCKDNKSSWRTTWVFLSVEQVTEYELMSAFGTYRVAQGFDLLVERGYLSRRKNPAVKVDQTYQYRFEAEKVQEAVNALSPFFNFEDWRLQNQTLHPLELKNAKFKTKETIPHDPPHSPEQQPPQKEQELPAQAPPVEAGEESQAPVTDEPPAVPSEVQPNVAVIDAYRDALRELGREPLLDNWYKRFGRAAKTFVSQKVSPERVRAATLAVYSDRFTDAFYKRRANPITLEELASVFAKAEEALPPAPIHMDWGDVTLEDMWSAQRDRFYKLRDSGELDQYLTDEERAAQASQRADAEDQAA